MGQEELTAEKSLGHLLKEVGSSASDLILREAELAKAELSVASDRWLKRATRLGIWAGLLALSTIPFIAFLIIGLGRLLNDNYWLSSLIISGAFAFGSAVYAWFSFDEEAKGLGLERSKRNLEAGAEAVKEKLRDLKDATKGELQ